MTQRSKYSYAKILAGIAITLLATWLSFRSLDWGILKKSFLQVNLIWVMLATANTIFTVFALGWRWQMLLRPKMKFSLNTLFRLNIITQYFNIITPGHLGEISKIYLASKRYGVSGAYVTGTIAIDKLCDLLVFTFLWVSVPVFFTQQNLVKGYQIAVVFSVLSLVFLFILVWHSKLALKWAGFFLKVLPKKFRKRVQDFFKNSIEAFESLRNVKVLMIVIILTHLFIISRVLTNFFLFKACNLNLSFWAGLFVLLVLQVGNTPPSTPGRIGVFEFSVILALAVFDIPRTQALSYAIVLHLVVYLPKILLGLIFLSSMGFSTAKISDSDLSQQDKS